MREAEDLIRREQLFVYLCICAFVWPRFQKNHQKKTNTQKTPSDGTVRQGSFVYLFICVFNNKITASLSNWKKLKKRPKTPTAITSSQPHSHKKRKQQRRSPWSRLSDAPLNFYQGTIRPILTAYQNFSPFFYFIAEMAKNRVLVSLDACSLPNQILTCSISFIIPINSCST